ncbi:ATP-binding protein [Thalassospira sp. TSL5-1]|uniref:sensor histidine kinase n=1 Tax=Thalassospira sp. TSL5-1 TaxID=1544451 RepID=UPI00093F685C|nr:ATP-binding protein [Thalassospira sp. TSL5-1]
MTTARRAMIKRAQEGLLSGAGNLHTILSSLRFWWIFGLIFLFCTLLFGAGLLGWYQAEQKSLREDRELVLERFTNRRENVLYNAFISFEQQLLIASETEDIRNFLSDDHSAATHLSVIVKQLPDIFQARILATNGREVIRVDRTVGGVVRIPDQDLQDKSDRYYYQRATKITADEVYISALDLNVENGKIEVPWRPTVRLISQILDKSGRKEGYLVFNIDASQMLAEFGSFAPRNVQTTLLNNDGYWLAGKPKQYLWGFMTGNETTLAKSDPVLWQKLESEKSNVVFEYADTLYTVRHLPLSGIISGGALIARQVEDNGLLVLGSISLESRLMAFEKRDFIFFAIWELLSGLLSWVGAHYLIKRRQTRDVQKRVDEQLLEVQRMASLGRIVAGVAHELRTPIGNALTTVSALSEDVDELGTAFRSSQIRRSTVEEHLEHLKGGCRIAQSNIERAVALIGHFKRTAVDQSTQNRRKFDLAIVLNSLLETVRPEFRKSSIILRKSCPAGLAMESYPSAIDQIILNLLQNAKVHAFVGRKSGMVSVRAFALTKDTICIEIVDDGVGIPAEFSDRIFEPFWSTKWNNGGSGLGLSVVANVVNRVLMGEITVNSVEGEGTTFRIVIPATAPLASVETDLHYNSD